MPVRWSQDGFPYLTKGDELVPRIIQMEGVKRAATTTSGNFEKNDDFNTPKLGLEWMTLRGAATDLYSLNENPGFLTLKCADVASNELKSPAFVSRRLQHHQFECATSMYFNPRSDSEMAGMLMYKDEQHQYLMSVGKDGGQKKISLKKITGNEAETLAAKALPSTDGPIELKVVSTGNHFSFYYAFDGGEWNLLIGNIDTFFLSTAQSYGFTGTTIGLYASCKSYKFNN
jgi:alpha-N-arabinofuranosidase